eukprot:1236154-Amorphochlora_amoeboformis.AAC.1
MCSQSGRLLDYDEGLFITLCGSRILPFFLRNPWVPSVPEPLGFQSFYGLLLHQCVTRVHCLLAYYPWVGPDYRPGPLN